MYLPFRSIVFIASLFKVSTQEENVITTRINIFSLESIVLLNNKKRIVVNNE